MEQGKDRRLLSFPLGMCTRSLFLTLAMAGTVSLSAQSGGIRGIKTENLPDFDNRPFHFGFLLGYNTSDFYMDLKAHRMLGDTLLEVGHDKSPGFNLGIISSWNLSKNFSVRFLPTLSFQDRVLIYRFNTQYGVLTYEKPVESTYLEFPVLIKFRSDRINNFAAYLIAGGKYSKDMASQQDVDNTLDEDVVIKLERSDYSAEVGGGFDMFLTYFKFGIELKHSIGIPNLLIDDGTKFSTPIDRLRSKAWIFTLTFEG